VVVSDSWPDMLGDWEEYSVGRYGDELYLRKDVSSYPDDSYPDWASVPLLSLFDTCVDELFQVFLRAEFSSRSMRSTSLLALISSITMFTALLFISTLWDSSS